MTLQHYEHIKHPVASPVLLLFWPVLLIVDGFQIRSWLLQNVHQTAPTYFWLLVARTSCAALAYIIELLPRPVSDYQLLGEEVASSQNRCDMATAVTNARFVAITLHPPD